MERNETTVSKQKQALRGIHILSIWNETAALRAENGESFK